MPQPKLSFTTHNHEFFIALPASPQTPVPAHALAPNTEYLISVQVKNPTTSAVNGTFRLTGGIFMIGNPPSPTPNIVVQLIEGATGNNPWNEEWVTFNYKTGPSGHGCLRIAIVAENGSPIASPLCVYQNLDIIGTPTGITATDAFGVYLPPPKDTVYLWLTETPHPGATTPTWNPKMVLPSSTPGSIDANGVHGYVGGPGTTPGGTYVVQLQVTPPAGASGSHDFTIYGAFIDQLITDANNPNFAGLVTITVTATPTPAPKSKLWLYGDGNLGGQNNWRSPDILLYDKLTSTPMGQYTPLQPNRPYEFRACIHNDGADAKGVIVQFLRADGGAFLDSELLANVQLDIPQGIIQVTSPVDFISAPSGGHCCAWVKIYANNNETGPELCAYRNTDSAYVIPGWLFEIPLQFKMPLWMYHGPEPLPANIEVKTLMLPAGWDKHPKIMADLQAVSKKGTRGAEIMQTPAFEEMLKKTALPIELKAGTLEGGKTAEVGFRKSRRGTAWQTELTPKLKEGVPFVVTGKISEDAKPGEAHLVEVTVKYPKVGRFPAQQVQFNQLYHVVEKLDMPKLKVEQPQIRPVRTDVRRK
jgi:hypothetical protein